MPPPAILVRSARCAWHWQWLRLMQGLGPADLEGNYRRPLGAFPSLPPLPDDAATPGGHVLLVGRSCPWAHRAWIVWSLRRLAGTIELLVVEPDPEAGRWRFPEPFEGCTTLLELYRLSGSDRAARATVPALYSRSGRRILVSESARLIEMLNRWPTTSSLDLEPQANRVAIDSWRSAFQEAVNDGVYRCGFARTQAAYDRAEAALFDALDLAEKHLQASGSDGVQWLCGGPNPSLADVVLFTTLIRWELVYAPLFGCSRRPLWQFACLWRWRARFFLLAGVAATCSAENWRRDYFAALFPLHPSGVVPAGPDLATLVTATAPTAPSGPP